MAKAKYKEEEDEEEMPDKYSAVKSAFWTCWAILFVLAVFCQKVKYKYELSKSFLDTMEATGRRHNAEAGRYPRKERLWGFVEAERIPNDKKRKMEWQNCLRHPPHKWISINQYL